LPVTLDDDPIAFVTNHFDGLARLDELTVGDHVDPAAGEQGDAGRPQHRERATDHAGERRLV
jgi:hypothetical protein